MSTIYNKTYKVPAWVLVTAKDEGGLAALKYLVDNGAYLQDWPAFTFKNTVEDLGKRGWQHVVKQKMPYTIESSFMPVAVAAHIKKALGDAKMLSGAPSQPWHHVIDRTVQSEADWERIFNEILQLEDSTTLSHIFDVGNKCYGNSMKFKVFFTPGDVPKNVLQRISDSVIVVGEQGEIPTKGKSPEEVVSALDSMLMKVLGI